MDLTANLLYYKNWKNEHLLQNATTTVAPSIPVPHPNPEMRILHDAIHPLGLVYNEHVQVIICKECRKAIVSDKAGGISSAIKAHINNKNHQFSTQFITQLNLGSLDKNIPSIPFRSFNDLKQLQDSFRSSPPIDIIPHLETQTMLRCDHCFMLRGDKNSLSSHNAKDHAGQRYRNDQWVLGQALLPGAGRQWFQVKAADIHLPNNSFDFHIELDRLVSSFTRCAIPDTSELRPTNGGTSWTERMGWEEDDTTIAQLDLLSPLVDEDDATSEIIRASLRRLMESGLADISRTSKLSLRDLKSSTREASMRPFRSKQRAETHDRYLSYWHSLIVYLYRLISNPLSSKVRFKADTQGLFHSLQKELSKDNPDTKEIDDLISCISICLMKQTLAGPSMTNPILHFVRTFCYNRKSKTFRPVTSVTPILAGMVWVARLLTLRTVWANTDDVIVNETDTVSSSLHIEEEPEDEDEKQSAVFRKILFSYKLFLLDSEPYAIGDLISCLALGKAITSDSWLQGDIFWSPDGMTISYKGELFDIVKFVDMQHQLIQRGHQFLRRLLLLKSEPLPTIDAGAIKDDLRNDSAGYSFIFDERNNFGDYFGYILHRIDSNPDLKERFFRDDEPRFHSFLEYIATAEEFLETVLAPLLHFTGGLPPRATEMIDLLVHNLGMGSQRGIYVVAGIIMLVSHYNKTQALTGLAKVVPRFLSVDVSQLLLLYILIVQPFCAYARTLIYGEENNTASGYLFATDGKRWAADRYSEILGKTGTFYMDFELKISRYRQIISAIAKRFCSKMAVYEAVIVQKWDPMANQFGHGEQVDESVYGIDAELLATLTPRTIEEYKSISRQWHQFLDLETYEISPWILNVNYIKSIRRERQGILDDAPALPEVPQATNSSSELRDIQRTLKEQQQLILTLIQQQQQQQQQQNPPLLQPQHSYQPPLPQHSQATPIPPAIFAALESHHGFGASFRSPEQASALHHLYQRTTPLMFIFRTGGGKTDVILTSTLITTPHMRKVTIMILPFIGACVGLAERAASKGIHSVYHWQCSRLDNRFSAPKSQGLVLVTPESASTPEFGSYVDELRASGSIGTFVFDEVHEIPLSHGYRRMHPVTKLLKHGEQLVVMSATLPPTMVPEIQSFFGVQVFTSVRVPTNRHNIHYFVHETDDTFEFCLRSLRMWNPTQHSRILVFCRSKRAAKNLYEVLIAEGFSSFIFHADLSDNEKYDQLCGWSKNGGVMCATSSLGASIDVPGVTMVILMGIAYTIAEAAQQTGRGGRSGEANAFAMIIHTPYQLHSLTATDYGAKTWKLADKKAHHDFLSTRSCRRFPLSLYLDGTGAECRTLGQVARCDNCDGMIERQQQQQAGIARQITYQEMARTITTFLTQCVDGICLFCRLLGDIGCSPRDHPTRDCAIMSGEMHRFEAWAAEFELPDLHACKRCGLPPSICTPGLVCNFQRGAGFLLGWLVLKDSEIKCRVEEELRIAGLDFSSAEEWRSFLQHPCDAPDGRKATNLWRLALAFAKLGLIPF